MAEALRIVRSHPREGLVLRNKKWIAGLGAALLIPALILSGCGGKKKAESSSNAPPTQSSASPQPTTAPSSSNNTSPTTAPGASSGNAGAASDLAEVFTNFLKSKSWRATLTREQPGQPTVEGSIEYVGPDKYHYALTGLGEAIQIGGDTYVKLGATWTKYPGGVPGNLFNIDTVKTAFDSFQQSAQKGGTATVNGTSCQVYTVTDSSSGSTYNVCTANGLPLRLVVKDGDSTSTVLFEDFDKVPDIKAPI
jgi:hypothetical protein